MIKLLVFLLLQSSSLTNILTVMKETDITCVASKADESAIIYINPPITAGFSKTPNKIDDPSWNNDDWFTENKDPSSYGLITDKRWEGFKTFETSEKGPVCFLDDTPIPFSIYVKQPITFNVTSRDYSSNKTFTVKFPKARRKGYWLNFIFREENNTIRMLSKEGDIFHAEQIGFNGPYNIYIVHASTWFKLHEPDYVWSNTATNGQKETYIDVSLSDNLCISVYVSVDKNCFLNITLETKNNARYEIVPGFNKKNEFKQWKKIEITADSPGPARFSFRRLTNVKNEKYGYWAIGQIEFCSRNIEIYRTNVPASSSGDHRCEMLNQPNNVTYDIKSLADTPGVLGNVSCETVLGPSYPYCEKHTICLGSDCFCSWGYQGPSCERPCDEGYHGLFCTKRCINGTTYHPSTGDCSENNDESNASHTVAAKEEETLLNESEDFLEVKVQEKDKVDANDGAYTLHPLSLASEMNPPTPTINTISTTLRTSTITIITVTLTILLVFCMCACAVGVLVLVWYFKNRNHPISSKNQTDESAKSMLDPNKQRNPSPQVSSEGAQVRIANWTKIKF